MMYAIVEIAGQQFKVEEGKKIFVHRLEAAEGETVQFDKVLLVEDNGEVMVGEPVVKDFIVEGEVINDKVRGDKVIVFKKKRKKGYRVKKGHRQNFTQIEILHIGDKNIPVKPKIRKKVAEPVKDTEPVEDSKTEEKKTVTRKSTAKKPAEKAKKSDTGKTAEKKPAAKKRPAKKTPESEE